MKVFVQWMSGQESTWLAADWSVENQRLLWVTVNEPRAIAVCVPLCNVRYWSAS